MQCRSCHVDLVAGSTFCSACGERVVAHEGQQPSHAGRNALVSVISITVVFALLAVIVTKLAGFSIGDLIGAFSPRSTSSERPASSIPTPAPRPETDLQITQYQCVWVQDSLSRDLHPLIQLDARNASSREHEYFFKARFFDSRNRLVDESSATAEIPAGLERGPIRLHSAKGFIGTSELSAELLKTALLSEADPNHPSKWRAELLVKESGSDGTFTLLKTSPILLQRSQ